MQHLLAVIALFTIALAAPAAAQDATAQLVGTWRLISQSVTEVESRRVTKPFGEKPGRYTTYTKGGRLHWVHVGDGRQKPAVPLKDEDRVNLFNTLSAGSGTFKVEGGTLIVAHDTSWNELWTGVTIKRQFEISGDNLTITSTPYKNASGIDVFFSLVLEKVE